MSAPLGPWTLAGLIAGTWTTLGALVLVHRRLNRNWPVRQATDLTRHAAEDKP